MTPKRKEQMRHRCTGGGWWPAALLEALDEIERLEQQAEDFCVMRRQDLEHYSGVYEEQRGRIAELERELAEAKALIDEYDIRPDC